MSLSINKKIKKSTKLSSSSSLLANDNAKANATITAASTTATTNILTRKRRAYFNQHQHQHHQQQQQQYKRKPKITKTTSKISSGSLSLTALTPVLQETSNINVGNTLYSTLSTAITATATGSSAVIDADVKSLETANKVGHKIFRTTAMPSFKIMSYQNLIALITVLVCGLVTVNGLKCYMCGQYNEGVGSITPCLNYSEQYAHLYLKECSKKSEKYCVKYVSELSIVRDCATECAEKEIWETQTYCCTEDGCNGSNTIEASAVAIILPVVFYIVNEMMKLMKQQRR